VNTTDGYNFCESSWHKRYQRRGRREAKVKQADEQDRFEEKLARCLQQIRGVRAASVACDTDGQVAEVHLVGSVSRPAKQIVRDAESLLHAQFGIPIDYRKISLVQLDGETVTSHPSRLRLIHVTQRSEPTDCVEVLLQGDQARFAGLEDLIEGMPDDQKAQAAARATLAAIQQAIGQDVPLTLGKVQLLAPTEQQVCLAIVTAKTAKGDECLSGSCLVTHGVLEAGCKATLDALNRRLPVWISQPQAGDPTGHWAPARS
jgi:hypothetical protein